MDHLLLAIQELFQEVYGYVVVRRQVSANVTSEEVIALSLATVLGLELFC